MCAILSIHVQQWVHVDIYMGQQYVPARLVSYMKPVSKTAKSVKYIYIYMYVCV